MRINQVFSRLCLLMLSSALSISCASTSKSPVILQPPTPQLVEAPVLLIPKSGAGVPRESRIVIADIEGQCSEHVKNALMSRLIDNENYSVLTRENLEEIVSETKMSWAGDFNTDTANHLGQLLGASMWIVGRVSYCGQTLSNTPQSATGPTATVLAALQIIDLETGTVLVSSSSEGRYEHREIASAEVDSDKDKDKDKKRKARQSRGEPENGTQPMTDDRPIALNSATSVSFVSQPPNQTAASASSATRKEKRRALRLAKRARRLAKKQPKQIELEQRIIFDKDERRVSLKEFVILKAAEDMANKFADKFFSRPSWEYVEIWDNPIWAFSEANALIKLGDCPAAIRFIEREAAIELPEMEGPETAQYLHNLGVALLCANRIEAAEQKLRAAYRISTDSATSRMLNLAGKISEWSLEVAREEQPEMKRLILNADPHADCSLPSDNPGL